MLNSFPTNRNVFVGNLNYKVDESVLKTLFETLVVNDQQSLLTVNCYQSVLLDLFPDFRDTTLLI